MRLFAIIAAAIAAMVFAAPAGAHTTRLLGNPCDGPEDPFNVILGTRAADRLVGTDCNDAIFGYRGGDVIRGKLGYDVLRGGRGPDRIVDYSFLVGGVIRGGPGNDVCVVVANTLIQVSSCETVIEV